MREIAEDPGPFSRCVVGRREWIGASSQVFHVVVNPIANGRHSGKTVLQSTKFMLSKPHQHVGFTIATGIEVWNNLRRDSRWHSFGDVVPFLNAVHQFNGRLIRNPKRPWRSGKAMMSFFVPQRNGFLDLINWSSDKLFIQDPLERVSHNANVENKRARSGNLIVEVTAHTKR